MPKSEQVYRIRKLGNNRDKYQAARKNRQGRIGVRGDEQRGQCSDLPDNRPRLSAVALLESELHLCRYGERQAHDKS